VIHRADLLLGRGFENQAKFDEARSAYSRVIESESGKGTETAAEAQFRLAESYLKQNNFEQAFKEYYKVYTGYDAPGYESAALYQAARSDTKMKNWKGAVQTFKVLLEEFPESEYADDAQVQLTEIETAFPELKKESN
ncbi:tetratricopeptide repeat protein, partial [Planctomicrobium sp.]